jgi:hypothetical protein
MDTISSPQAAGMPFTTTIRALDQFGNVVQQNVNVDLSANTGATTMSPTSISLVNGVFTGNLTMFTATTTAKITMSNSSVPSAARYSNVFTVNVSPMGYQKLLLWLPGEQLAPGTAAGKTGTPTPQATGLVFFAHVLACDPYYNPLDVPGRVTLSRNHLLHFGWATVYFVNVNGHA